MTSALMGTLTMGVALDVAIARGSPVEMELVTTQLSGALGFAGMIRVGASVGTGGSGLDAMSYVEVDQRMRIRRTSGIERLQILAPDQSLIYALRIVQPNLADPRTSGATVTALLSGSLTADTPLAITLASSPKRIRIRVYTNNIGEIAGFTYAFTRGAGLDVSTATDSWGTTGGLPTELYNLTGIDAMTLMVPGKNGTYLVEIVEK